MPAQDQAGARTLDSNQPRVEVRHMADRIKAGSLQVDKELYDFINREALPGTGISAEGFWADFDRLIHDLSPRNRDHG